MVTKIEDCVGCDKAIGRHLYEVFSHADAKGYVKLDRKKDLYGVITKAIAVVTRPQDTKFQFKTKRTDDSVVICKYHVRGLGPCEQARLEEDHTDAPIIKLVPILIKKY